MGLEDFERELAAAKESKSERIGDRPQHKEEDDHRHRHRHHHKSSRHSDSRKDDKHRRKRSRDREHSTRDDRHRSKRIRSESPHAEANDDGEDEWVEKEAMEAPPEENILDERDEDLKDTKLSRDSWMNAPSALDVDYVQRSRTKKSPPSQFVSAKEDHQQKIHKHEIQQLMKDLEDDEDPDQDVKDEPAQHEVSYTFGDSGSQWRMTKLKAVYRQAKEEGSSVEEVALKRYGDLRDFDDAREEERELDRREMYGKDYVGLEKPSGELFQERKLAAGLRHGHNGQSNGDDSHTAAQGKTAVEQTPAATTVPLDQTALNKLKAKMMKAKLRNDPSVADLEAEYNAAIAASANSTQSDVIVLSNMDNRLLAGGRGNEVKAITTKRGQSRGQVEENTDMSIEDMVRQERRTRNTGQGNEGLLLANRIAKDAKFTDDLEYMDDNAGKLATREAKTDASLRSTAIGAFQKQQRILDACPLCHHEDRNEPPAAPLVSLATRTYMTLPPEPELARYGAVVVPVQHRANLLECDDDEWEELRNFMKALTRFYAAQDKGVIFYENAAEPRARGRHAALVAVPLSWELADAAPGFFKEAVLQADEEWSQHRKIIDTARGAREKFGKQAMRKMMVKEMPYFHVWFNLDGGLGHVVEDERRWPKGDLFAREVIGGMLERGPETIKKQGRWVRRDHRVEKFRSKWDAFDWTKVLMDAQ